MADEQRCWYPLDGTWHKSVAPKLSALHLSYSERGGSMCDRGNVLLKSDGYTSAEAIADRRPFCARCCKAAGIGIPTSTRGAGS